MGKYVSVGLGTSTNKDSYKAAKEAAEKAVKECGKKASFAIIYIDSSYDPQKVAKGLKEALKQMPFVGISADKQFNHKDGYFKNPVISVLCLSSDYMHFNIGVAENYRKNPFESGKAAIASAMKGVKSDYVDAYMQFSRIKKSDFSHVVRTPPYFIIDFASGAKLIKGKAIPGQESEFLNGILSFTGPNIPIFGGSASSSFEDYVEKGVADNFQIVNGKCYKDAAVVVFVISNLSFATIVEHGYVPSNDYAALTKVDKTGYEILEINGKEPVEEYARLLGISKEEYLKDPSKHSLTRPFGLVDIHGQVFIREALPNPDSKTLHSTFKVYANSVLNITKHDEKRTFTTVRNILEDSIGNKEKKVAVSIFCNCSGRRPLLNGKENDVVKIAQEKFKSVPMFGFYSFGEIGSTATTSALAHSQTVTALVIFDELLTEQ